MSLQADVQAIVKEILGDPEIGIPVIIRTTPVIDSDPVAGTVTKGPSVDVPANAYFDKINQFNAPGALIETGDRLAYIDTELTIEDLVIDPDGEVWNVISLVETALGPGRVLWSAQIRR